MAIKKFRFIEDFLDPKTGQPKETLDSPKYIETKNFGKRLLHKIARCEYEEKTEDGETFLIENMGELGGWIEQESNLSQSGGSWVKPNAIVCMNASVSDDAVIESGEVGDSARVKDSSVVREGACIKERSLLIGDAEVAGNVVVGGISVVSCKLDGDSKIGGRARLLTNQKIQDVEYEDDDERLAKISNSEIGGEAIVKGSSRISDSKVIGNCVINNADIEDGSEIEGDSMIEGSVLGKVHVYDCYVMGTGIVVRSDRLKKGGELSSLMDGTLRAYSEFIADAMKDM